MGLLCKSHWVSKVAYNLSYTLNDWGIDDVDQEIRVCQIKPLEWGAH